METGRTLSLSSVLSRRWKTILALLLALVATLFNLLFIWGLFCLFWGIENIRSREAYFVERIERSVNPVLYWIIIGVWFLLGLTYLMFDPRFYLLESF